ncbi:response regulator transcription factor [Nocardia sp. NPDC059240]|uniref:response regulator transcription factor n=1 Tax=Nocardia sp. NPDC059240 TaxID=3346786 RepID=UPI0036B4D3E3
MTPPADHPFAAAGAGGRFGEGTPMSVPITYSPPHTRPALSPREIEVLLTWLRCDSKEAAAQELYLSVATVSTHIARIRAKYVAAGRGAATKAALFARAVQDQILDLDEW